MSRDSRERVGREVDVGSFGSCAFVVSVNWRQYGTVPKGAAVDLPKSARSVRRSLARKPTVSKELAYATTPHLEARP